MIDAAAGGRRGGGMGTFGPINPEVSAGATLTRSRARYLATNNPWLVNGVDNWSAALVGAGIRPTPRADDAGTRRAASRALETWADQADAAGRTDFWGLQRDIARHLIVDGEALVIIHDDADGIRLQVVAPEQLDEAKTAELGGGRLIVSGVEFDAQGRRVAYWLLPIAPMRPSPTTPRPSASTRRTCCMSCVPWARGRCAACPGWPRRSCPRTNWTS